MISYLSRSTDSGVSFLSTSSKNGRNLSLFYHLWPRQNSWRRFPVIHTPVRSCWCSPAYQFPVHRHWGTGTNYPPSAIRVKHPSLSHFLGPRSFGDNCTLQKSTPFPAAPFINHAKSGPFTEGIRCCAQCWSRSRETSLARVGGIAVWRSDRNQQAMGITPAESSPIMHLYNAQTFSSHRY